MNKPDDGASVDTAPSAPIDENRPGFALDGHPQWRAGAFGLGGGLLGMHRTAGDPGNGAESAGSVDAGLAPAAYFGKGPDVLPDYQTKSWRWNAPDAVAYEIERKQQQIEQLRGMTNAIEGLGILNVLPGWTGRGLGVAGAFLGHGEAAHLQDQLDALEARQKQLGGRGAS